LPRHFPWFLSASLLATFMTGSVGTPREGAYSDVDPMFLVSPERFDEVDRGLPGLFAQAGIQPLLWCPERSSTGTLRSYAVLFTAGDKPVQYDITAAAPDQTWPIRLDQRIFDRDGVLRMVPPGEPVAASPDRLRWRIAIC
jgi:hypothetical protein